MLAKPHREQPEPPYCFFALSAHLFLVLLLPVLMLISGFFSGSETALFSLRPAQLKQITHQGTIGRTIHALLSDTRELLITILVGNTCVNIAFFAIVAQLAISMQRSEEFPAWFASATVPGATLLMILCSEVAPKQIAAAHPQAFSRMSCVPMLLLHRLMRPVRWFLRLLLVPASRLVLPRRSADPLSSEELAELLTLSKHSGHIDADEERMLRGIIELGSLNVQDLMVPRVDLAWHDLNDDPNMLAQTLRQTELSILPVCQRDLDHVVGFVRARDVLISPPAHRRDVTRLAREPLFVPELQSAESLLRILQQRNLSVAVVVDEYGGTAGLVTLEDVMEHLVGHIAGSWEPNEEVEVEPLHEGVFRISADLSVRDWAFQLGRGRMGRKERAMLSGVTTVGGLTMSLLGRLPQEGDEMQFGDLLLRVERMQGRRISHIIVRVQKGGSNVA